MLLFIAIILLSPKERATTGRPYKRYGIGGQRPRRPILLYHVIQSLYYATLSVL